MGSNILLILIHLCLWVYVLYYLFNGSKIQVELEAGNNLFVLIIFIILGIIVLINNFSLKGIISLLSFMVAGYLYSVIPSGYNEEAVYIRGKKYLLKRIDYVEIDEINHKWRLTFEIKRKGHFLFSKIDMKDRLENLEDLIKEKRK